MRTALIVHGMPLRDMYLDPATPSPSNYHWIPWLQKQLLLNNVLAQAPEMPTPYEPDFEFWSQTFGGLSIDGDTTLVGWSGGGGFLVRWLSERRDVRVRKVVLVAPWVDPSRTRTGAFFDFSISPELVTRSGELVVFYSDNDTDPSVEESAHRILAAAPAAKSRIFHLGHFGHWDMPVPEFPDLLNEVLG
jgi:predicted alpha/beta hydrolase family esterase